MDVSTMATTTVRKGLEFEASIEIVTPQAAEGLADFYAPVIKPEEARLSTMLTSRGSEASTLQPQIVDVSMSQSSPVWHVGGHRITDRQSLERVLATLPVSPGLSVSLAADVPVGAGVAVVEAARLAGFTSVRWDDIDDR